MKKYFIANWKSNKTREEVVKWMDQFGDKLKSTPVDSGKEVIIAPAMPSVMFVSNRLLDKELFSSVKLAVQDLSPFPAGSYTGGVSARNLEGFDVRYAIVGHSERRRYFHETSQDVANKVTQCLENNIVPILCVDTPYLKEQAEALAADQLEKCIVAYEPLEAIGSGDNQPVDEVVEVVERIKKLFGKAPVLYGGSVTPANVADYLEVTDGVLVGGASLDAEKFSELVSRD